MTERPTPSAGNSTSAIVEQMARGSMSVLAKRHVRKAVAAKYKGDQTALQIILNEARAGDDLQRNGSDASFAAIIRYAERALSYDPLSE